MKSKNQEGFSIVEVLILLVVAGLIAGGAWYVSKHNSGKNNAKASTAQSAPSSSSDPKASSSQIPSGWTTYEDKRLGIKLAHPKDWKVEADASAREPFAGTEFGNQHTFYGTFDINLITNDAFSPSVHGLVFSSEGTTFSALSKNALFEWQSVNPFKASQKTENFNLDGGGQGIMVNQVTADYSDLIFYLDVGNKFFYFNFREQTIANGGSTAHDYTKYSDDATKMVKSIQKL